MKSFLVKCVLALCITFCCLFYLDMMYEQKTESPLGEINVFQFIPNDIQIANVGSSHGQCDFNWIPLTKERGISTFNFALTSQSYEYDYALINMHQDDFVEGSLLFIPVSYFSFNREATDPNDIEAISVRYYRLLSPKYNPDYSLYKDLVAVRFPVLSAGEKIFDLFKPPVTFPSLSENRPNIIYAAELSPEGTEDGAADQGAQTGTEGSVDQEGQTAGSGEAGQTGTDGDVPPDRNPEDAPAAEGEAAPGQVPAQTPEELYGAETVQGFQEKGLARYERHFLNKEEYFEADKIQDLKNMIELCQRKGITPILITTPFTVYYNQYVSDEFLQGFYATIHSLTSAYGVSYYDYSHDERFQTSLQYFGDADHLNGEGADYFTGLLMEEVPELKTYLETH